MAKSQESESESESTKAASTPTPGSLLQFNRLGWAKNIFFGEIFVNIAVF